MRPRVPTVVPGKSRRAHVDDLREWHELLSQRLVGSEQEHLIDRLGVARVD